MSCDAMLYEEINMMFTGIVNEYLRSGYYINTMSQRGSQGEGEICKVDLTDGEEIVRVVIETTRKNRLDGIRIRVGKIPEESGVKPNWAREIGVAWNNKLEIISEREYYQLGLGDSNGVMAYGSYEDAVKARGRRVVFDFG